jgi:hypothetical protein
MGGFQSFDDFLAVRGVGGARAFASGSTWVSRRGALPLPRSRVVDP